MQLEIFWDAERFPEETATLAAACDGKADGSFLIASDFSQPERVLDRLIAARRVGDRIALCPRVTDPYEQSLATVVSQINMRPTADERLILYGSLATDSIRVEDRRIEDMTQLSEATLGPVRFAIKLSDICVFATVAERSRFEGFLKRQLVRFAFLDLPEPAHAIPAGRHVCVYAPHLPRERLRFVEDALADWRAPITIICGEDQAVIPGDAAIVVLPEWWRPIQAAYISARGHRIVAPRHGGSDERGHAIVYDETNLATLRRALQTALMVPGPRVTLRVHSGDIADALRATTEVPAQGPLASVIVRTFDRPALLERALASIVAQTYRPLEAVVVNGGGPDVRALVERFADTIDVTYIDALRRTTISESSNIGVRAARGSIIGYLDDDDVLYPDHLGLTVDMLERTGVDLAYTNCIAEYAEMRGDEKHVLGFTMFLERDFDRDSLYVTNVAPIHSIVHRRDVFERFGFFNEEFRVCDDWEMWLRIAQAGDFAHIDRATCEYSWRWDPERGANMTLSHQDNFVLAHGRIYEAYAEVTAQRPGVVQRQQEALTFLRNRAAAIAEDPARARELLFGH